MAIISFVNMKGGVAKTTLAVNFADCLSARYGKKVLVIDIDPQFNATQCLMKGDDFKKHIESKKHTIVDVFDTNPRPKASSVSDPMITTPSKIEDIKPIPIKNNLDLIPGNLELYRLEMAGGQGRELRLKRLCEHFKKNSIYDVIIIDTPPTPSVWMSSALIASDYYLIPVKPEPLSATGIDLLRSVINTIEENHALSLKCAGVVLTMAEPHTIVYDNAVSFIDSNRFWKGKRISTHLPKRTAIARMQGSQQLIWSNSGDEELKRDLAKIVQEVIAKIDL